MDARHSSDLLGVRVTTGLALLWLVGLFLLGLALLRSGTVPRPAAATLIGSTLAFIVFAGPFVPAHAGPGTSGLTGPRSCGDAPVTQAN